MKNRKIEIFKSLLISTNENDLNEKMKKLLLPPILFLQLIIKLLIQIVPTVPIIKY